MEETPNEADACAAGIHYFPDQDFEIGPRICLKCGVSEY